MRIVKLLHALRIRHDGKKGRISEDGQGRDESKTMRRIVRQMESLEPERARYIAAFAYILSRVARADMNISDAETREIEDQVVRLSSLPVEQAILAVPIAKTQATLFGGTDNFLVTQKFNAMADVEQKLALLDCLFAVAATDQVIFSVEEREIRLIND